MLGGAFYAVQVSLLDDLDPNELPPRRSAMSTAVMTTSIGRRTTSVPYKRLREATLRSLRGAAAVVKSPFRP
jgi:hypothetical protein